MVSGPSVVLGPAIREGPFDTRGGGGYGLFLLSKVSFYLLPKPNETFCPLEDIFLTCVVRTNFFLHLLNKLKQ